jgi:hypothetical protein
MHACMQGSWLCLRFCEKVWCEAQQGTLAGLLAESSDVATHEHQIALASCTSVITHATVECFRIPPLHKFLRLSKFSFGPYMRQNCRTTIPRNA